ncbi:hypothetical protein Dimus_023822 [Dionaea muscipula]
MGLTSLQVCMDSSDDHWLQGTIAEDGGAGIDSSSSPSGELMTCSRPGGGLMERRLRPQHDQALKCPRCDSTHTKFCYYNNYSLSQPRYFCKTCRRYWTKGGTLRNIPVGGGCRKNKKPASNSSSKKSSSSSSSSSSLLPNHHHQHNPNPNPNPDLDLGVLSSSSLNYPINLQLSFPDQVQFSDLTNLIGTNGNFGCTINNFMENKYNPMLENSTTTPNRLLLQPIDFMESKLEGVIGNNSTSVAARGDQGHDHFVGNGNDFGILGDQVGDLGTPQGLLVNSFRGLCSPPFGHVSIDHENNNSSTAFLDNFQRLMLPYDDDGNNIGQDHDPSSCCAPTDHHDVKPNTKLLSLEWQDHDHQGSSAMYPAGKDLFGYNIVNNLASWNGGGITINGYGSSGTANSLV